MKTARNQEIATRYRDGATKAVLGREYELGRRQINGILRQHGHGLEVYEQQPPTPEAWIAAHMEPYEDETVREWLEKRLRAWWERAR